MSEALLLTGRWFRRCLYVLGIFLLIPGCASTGAAGTLVIAGGGLGKEAGMVYARFLEHAIDGPIIILPGASASPARSGAAVGRQLEDLDPGREMVVLAGDTATPVACGGAWLTGGVQSRLADVLLPPGGGSEIEAGLRDILRRGGVIGGTSAGAAIMSDPMILGGRSETVLAEGSISLRDGLGYFPWGIIDQHFLRRGRLGRLVVALEQSGYKHGFGIDERCAIIVDLQSNTIEVLGDGGLLFLDASMMEKDGRSSMGLRISLYADGAVLDGRSGRLRNPVPAMPEAGPETGEGILVIEGDPWEEDRIRDALVALRDSGEHVPRVVEVRGDDVLVRLSMDEMSSRVPAGNASSPSSLLGIRLDIIAQVKETQERR